MLNSLYWYIFGDSILLTFFLSGKRKRNEGREMHNKIDTYTDTKGGDPLF